MALKVSAMRQAKFGYQTTLHVWKRSKGRCWYCGIKMVQPKGDPKTPLEYVDRMFTLDHMLPQSRGGTDDVSNLVGCCRRCNNLKGQGTLDFLRVRMLSKKAKWPNFTHDQYEFLMSRGINIARFEKYKFHFEIAGLK
jgi:CRISPR/Cas system Type II protein with McrA/HNH and RuvC-like nuclease domain